jgi:hypothetical protein
MREWQRDNRDSDCPADAFLDLNLRVMAACDPVSSIRLDAMKARQRDALDLIVAQLAIVAWGAADRWTAFRATGASTRKRSAIDTQRSPTR